MKPSFAAIEVTDRQIRRAERRVALLKWRQNARNDWFKLWYGFWRPLVYFWLKVGGAVFASGLAFVFAGKILKVMF